MRIFISDCEGPISKNDHAFESTSHFVPRGDRLFTVVSRYDDVMADIVKRPGHKAGDTLRLVLPFLKAHSVNDEMLRKFAAQNLVLMEDAALTMQHVRSDFPAFIVSTSYEHYLRSLCKAIDFPFENTYCTRINLDKYVMMPNESKQLQQVASEIADMRIIKVPFLAQSLADFADEDRQTIRRLDEIFLEIIPPMKAGVMYRDVNPIGGSEKAAAVRDVVEKLRADLSEVMYVGDSITDEEVFRLVRENGGLSISFNGNQYAVKSSDIAILSQTTLVTAAIADVFLRTGKQRVLDLAESWGTQNLQNQSIDQEIRRALSSKNVARTARIEIITKDNVDRLMTESSEFRKKIRGQKIGELG